MRAAAAAAGLVALVAGCSGAEQPPTASSTASATSTATSPLTRPADPRPYDGRLPQFTPPPQAGSNCQYAPTGQSPAKNVDAPPTGEVPTTPASVAATIATDQGPIGLELNQAESPCTVNSFISLAQQGFFDDTDCHRLTTADTLQVLQCGDPSGNGTGGPGYEFANEYPTDQYPPGDPTLQRPVLYPRGTLAMANAGPDTNGSQFFLVYGDSQLPPNYTVFGTIGDEGLQTLDGIADAGVADGSRDGAPATPVTITSVHLD
ncbi:peptidylprolyl isomerase [Mycolicibacillus trivialis]|uniref:Peptidyl-prolyl cis-trans isomerase n=1 Tax=Mycolicibacillus trivialis TaxID=1798 RepID=A0A1X2EP59_9MYCO|nr:peptidylprolyl isomerase [Mycolicibacillus trivialis]